MKEKYDWHCACKLQKTESNYINYVKFHLGAATYMASLAIHKFLHQKLNEK